MKFPGVEQFLVRYRERAGAAGVDPLGLYIPPYAYAEMQILEAAINSASSLDDGKLAAVLRSATFDTVAGKIKFGAKGEWVHSRVLQVQYQKIKGHDVAQFKDMSTQVVVAPADYASGEVIYPYERAK